MPGVEVGPGSESRADAQGFPGNLGEPPVTLQAQPEDKEYRQNKSPGDRKAVALPGEPGNGDTNRAAEQGIERRARSEAVEGSGGQS